MVLRAALIIAEKKADPRGCTKVPERSFFGRGSFRLPDGFRIQPGGCLRMGGKGWGSDVCPGRLAIRPISTAVEASKEVASKQVANGRLRRLLAHNKFCNCKDVKIGNTTPFGKATNRESA